MGIGALEIALILIAAMFCELTVRKTKQHWLRLIPVFVMIAAVASPADLLSTLMIAVPNVILYCFAMRRQWKTQPST
ncbi:MAG: hypothetical protein CMJ78_25250 [Planctomycetaceae bacterium]|nr:hypothetical protein [Planctomycetaceae bacterium]